MLLPQILLDGAERFGPRLAVQDSTTEASYATLLHEALSIAAGLRASGLARGDRVVLVLPNGVDFVRAHFGVLLAGGVSVPLDATIVTANARHIVDATGARLLLGHATAVARLLPALNSSTRVIVAGGDPPAPLPPHVPTIGLAEFQTLAEPRSFLDGVRPDSVAAIMFTTGSTGVPKGVCLTHANVLAALRNICSYVGYTAADREVVVLPLSHNFGLGHLYCNLLNGGAVFTANGLTRVGRVLEAIERFGATGFPGTPLGYGMLLDKYAPVLATRGRNLRFAVINSAPLPPECTAQLQALLPQLDIMVYYGLTEASRATFLSLTRAGPKYFRSVGRALGSSEVAIRLENGSFAAPETSGEVVIRGPTITPGYWKGPAALEPALRDGWLHSGDLGYLDSTGHLFLTGRLKDVINVGGYKVNPGEIEAVLLGEPGIADAGVAGVEGVAGITGEAVVAAVVAAPGVTLDLAAIETRCVESLEKYKVPSRLVVLPSLPRSETGKVLRTELARQLAARLVSRPPC
jgi:long-chain acyl-CoA synthetase